MKNIASRENSDFRLLLRAQEGKRAAGERSSTPLPVALEGPHLCSSWLETQGQPELVFVDETRIDQLEVARILAQVQTSRIRLCTPALMKAASQVVQDQGIIFLVRAPVPQLPPLIEENCLWLDRVQDPGNLGTMLRTAAAAGIKRVYASVGCVAAWSPKVLRSAQGAHFALEIHEGQDLGALRERLRVPMLATALEGSESLYEADLPRHAAWVFGNEGRGVSQALLGAADLKVRIPQSSAVESLNVAIAAGICLFEQRRRLSSAGIQ